ncbi:selenide, water dikinase SelD [soil metagenome]
MEEIKLTEFSHGSGCGCKIAPAVLEKILQEHVPQRKFAELIVGYESRDDAAVYALKDSDHYLISTVDFFTPIVNDPFDFGRIAATNALSDVYAMGGTPILATAILGFPVEKIAPEIAQRIIEGGRKICEEAGIPLAGGHSIDAPEPFFGLSVNGLVHKNHLKKNNTAQPGDLLFLTKPIGTGIIASAMKKGKAENTHVEIAIQLMTALNRVGEKLGAMPGVHALTDVTGFGLLGHLIEMAAGSNCAAVLNYKNIPLIPGIETYMKQFIFPDNTYRNWNGCEKKVSGVNGPEFIPLCDPQTSGGLLIAISPKAEKDFLELMKEEKIECGLRSIGTLTSKQEFVVEVLT